MKQLEINKAWEKKQRSKGVNLRTAPDGRYLDRKTATVWTKYYNANK